MVKIPNGTYGINNSTSSTNLGPDGIFANVDLTFKLLYDIAVAYATLCTTYRT